jgi:hypothetical protein
MVTALFTHDPIISGCWGPWVDSMRAVKCPPQSFRKLQRKTPSVYGGRRIVHTIGFSFSITQSWLWGIKQSVRYLQSICERRSVNNAEDDRCGRAYLCITPKQRYRVCWGLNSFNLCTRYSRTLTFSVPTLLHHAQNLDHKMARATVNVATGRSPENLVSRRPVDEACSLLVNMFADNPSIGMPIKRVGQFLQIWVCLGDFIRIQSALRWHRPNDV